MADFQTDEHFRQFVENLNFVRKSKYGDLDGEDRLEQQFRQIKSLLELEDQFQKALLKHRWGPGIYKDFVDLICVKKQNILAARSFYRERQTFFAAKISPLFKARDYKALATDKFRMNWFFISFAVKSRKWSPNSDVVRLSKQINKIREEMLEMNLPLALSQAKIFWANTPQSHLTYMDLVQIQSQALLLAIDKFVPPTKSRMSHKDMLAAYRKFRPVAIGIMIRDRLNAYSDGLLHFYPKDKVKLYRANKLLRNFMDEPDYEIMSELVNQGLKDECKTSPEDLSSLVAANSMVSVSPRVGAGQTARQIHLDRYQSISGDDAARPDVRLEERQAHSMMMTSLTILSVLEKKLLRLKGMSLYDEQND